jgi:hypothetical protein
LEQQSRQIQAIPTKLEEREENIHLVYDSRREKPPQRRRKSITQELQAQNREEKKRAITTLREDEAKKE